MSKKKAAPKKKRSPADRKTTTNGHPNDAAAAADAAERQPETTTTTTKLSIWFYVTLIVAVAVGVVLSQNDRGNGDTKPDPVVHTISRGGTVVHSYAEAETDAKTVRYSDAASINGGSNNNNNNNRRRRRRAKLSEVFREACVATKLAECDLDRMAFDDERRTIFARRGVPVQTRLVYVSPELQLSASMAIADPRMKRFVDFGRRTEEHPPYLGLYLMMERKRLETKRGDPDDWSATDRFFRVYFDYLPTLEDFTMFHPGVQTTMKLRDGFSDGADLEPGFPPFAPYTDQIADRISREILHWYKSLSESIEGFDRSWSFEEFAWAEWITATRSYLQEPADEATGKDPIPRSFDNLTMLPLIDSFNEHPNVNVHWAWNHQLPGRVSSDDPDPLGMNLYADAIEAGSELLTSYGVYKCDYQKLGQYGYVNTDGSERFVASISPYHRPYFEVRSDGEGRYAEVRKEELRRYLGFGDGYEDCPAPHFEDENGIVKRGPGYLFQYARYKALLQVFPHPQYWFMDRGEGDALEIDGLILTTCRILATTHRDYEGMATPLLANFASPGTLRSSGDVSLDYRTYHVLERLATTTLSELRAVLSRTVETGDDGDGEEEEEEEELPIEEEAKIRLGSNRLDRSSLVGMTTYVAVREVEALHAVIALARDRKDRYLAVKQTKLLNGETVNEEDYVVRMIPCSLE